MNCLTTVEMMMMTENQNESVPSNLVKPKKVIVVNNDQLIKWLQMWKQYYNGNL